MRLESEDITDITLRMKRAHGHLAKVISMMEEGAECEDVLTQLAAVTKAISRSGYAVVTAGLTKCISQSGPDALDLKKMEKLFLALA